MAAAQYQYLEIYGKARTRHRSLNLGIRFGWTLALSRPLPWPGYWIGRSSGHSAAGAPGDGGRRGADVEAVGIQLQVTIVPRYDVVLRP